MGDLFIQQESEGYFGYFHVVGGAQRRVDGGVGKTEVTGARRPDTNCAELPRVMQPCFSLKTEPASRKGSCPRDSQG